MIVADAISKYRDKDIKIGSGVGFIYCGKCESYLPRLLDHLSKKEYKKLLAVLSDKEHLLEGLDAKWSNKKAVIIQDMVRNNRSETEIRAKMEKEDKLKEKERQKLLTAIKNCKEKIDKFSNFNTRQVKEVYKSIVDPNITIILIEGKETGLYWDAEEMMQDKQMRRIIDGFKRIY